VRFEPSSVSIRSVLEKALAKQAPVNHSVLVTHSDEPTDRNGEAQEYRHWCHGFSTILAQHQCGENVERLIDTDEAPIDQIVRNIAWVSSSEAHSDIVHRPTAKPMNGSARIVRFPCEHAAYVPRRRDVGDPDAGCYRDECLISSQQCSDGHDVPSDRPHDVNTQSL